ncbi:hypothetical protein SAMN02799630_03371 [Paenibacillus sp. UNCCL117]|uniref:DUF6933 domain-containing protein n=1 Tax=unclassified Paenibacillus TaxID=185978 RepID=UPI00088044FB|nr:MULTISPECIES: hypothetical protein [unclassified Paenibacillus]SDE44086.1 hypothetical protein SAMN04488602_12843 [Paenibacillus sp. cl123]SFW46160.1 hypothetical protein SAMN02799630_03371 [Paenibacillus sp. UNCCL117]
MIALKFTQSLLKDMKIAQVDDKDVSSFFSWHVNIYKLNNRKHILFVNDFTRLSILIDGVRSAQLKVLKDKFLLTLEAYLQSEGIESSLIDSYLNDASAMIISKTDNRSVLGTMKEVSLFSSDDFPDNIQRLKWLNRLIYKPIDYKEPIALFKETIRKQYLNGM